MGTGGDFTLQLAKWPNERLGLLLPCWSSKCVPASGLRSHDPVSAPVDRGSRRRGGIRRVLLHLPCQPHVLGSAPPGIISSLWIFECHLDTMLP
jgi:hypothetical protein